VIRQALNVLRTVLPALALCATVSVGLGLGLGLLATGCSGPGTRDSARSSDFVGPPTRVRYVDFRSGQMLELVNESHSNRVELYSQERNTAGTKVTTDEVIDELMKLFDKEGFDKNALPGGVPFAGEGYSSALEVEVGGLTRHLAMHVGATPAQQATYAQCKTAFVGIYTNVYSLQTVNNQDGTRFFENPSSSKS